MDPIYRGLFHCLSFPLMKTSNQLLRQVIAIEEAFECIKPHMTLAIFCFLLQYNYQCCQCDAKMAFIQQISQLLVFYNFILVKLLE